MQDNPSLYALWPAGTCATLGLAGSHNTSLTTLLTAMVNASNPAPVAATINARLAGLVSGAGGNSSSGAAIADRVGAALRCAKQLLQAGPSQPKQKLVRPGAARSFPICNWQCDGMLAAPCL